MQTSDQRANETFNRQGLYANNVLLRPVLSRVTLPLYVVLYTVHYIKYRDRGARTEPDRMCAVARYYDISSKADRGDIFIVHDQKSSYRTPLQCTNFLMATSSRIMHHVTKLKSSQTGFLNMTMSSLYSNGLHSHQTSIQ